jgi:hypothetical protein
MAARIAARPCSSDNAAIAVRGGGRLDGIVEFIATVVTSLAVALFAQFGIDLHVPQAADRPEIQRTAQPEPAAADAASKAGTSDDC